jgi:lysophospholipase L1-like esterase
MIRTMVAGFVMWAAALGSGVAGDAGFFLHDGDRVVLLGDSITEQRLYTTYIEGYTLARFPEQKFVFRNVGWGGDTSWLRQRAHPDENALFAAKDEAQQKMVETAVGAGLARDVLPLKPTVVTIDFGMNDHSYQPFREDIFGAYVRSQAELVKVLKQNGARVALLTSQPIEERRPDPDKDVRNESLRKFSDGLKSVATNQGALFVDQFDPYMSLMMRERAANPAAFIGGGDAVHPGPAGHTLMAWAILKGLGAPADVSSADLDVTRHLRSKVVSAVNCRVSNVKYAQGVLSFDRLDQALPMPIDPRAEAALKLAPVLDDLSRYELKVAGLKGERFDVTLDGEPAATITNEELGKGWNLANVPGPITKQVQQLLALVFKKNDVFFDRWRNAQLNPAAQQRLPELDSKIADLEREIDSARQPKVHHFEIKPAQQ